MNLAYGRKVRVLVVEDELRMATLLQRGLREEGYAVDVAHDGTDGLWLGTEQDYDAIVLDVMLHGIDGFEVCRRLRATDRWAPILLLTARLAVEDRVHGLDAGADDYLTKPFSFAELAARVRALVRRQSAGPPVAARVRRPARRPRHAPGDALARSTSRSRRRRWRSSSYSYGTREKW